MLSKDRFKFSSPNAIDAGEMPPSAPTRVARLRTPTSSPSEEAPFVPSTPLTPERRIISTSMNFVDARDNATTFLKDIEVSPTRGTVNFTTETFRDEEEPLVDSEYGDQGDEKIRKNYAESLSNSSTSTCHSERDSLYQPDLRSSHPLKSSQLGWHRPSRRGRKLTMPSLRHQEPLSEPQPAFSKFLMLFFCVAPLLLIVMVSFSISHVLGKESKSSLRDSQDETIISERLFRIIELLTALGVSNQTALAVRGTPQNLAAQWMADVDPLQYQIPKPGMTLDDSYHFIQRYVLVLLYHATGGTDTWRNDLDFLSDHHECSWYHSKKFTDGEVYAMGVSCRGSDLQVSDLLIRKSWHFKLPQV